MPNDKRPSPKVKVKVTYSGGHQPDLDKRIKAVLESVGCKWYGQGMDMREPFERDIVFDFPGE